VRALPTGTVTFLFTDVEGSTRLLHELGPDQYARALSEHRRLIREACSRYGGVEVDTQGDAFFVAFPTAPAALEAAQAGQAALASGPIRVRMGIHTGTPHVTEEGYVGVDVHRAARIAAVAHGGQVVISDATMALAGAHELRDLGEHRLKDLQAAERLWQLGDGDFPPLKSLYRARLPVPATPFLGRGREVRDVVELISREDVGLVTLTGPGGTGKTRLALQSAAEAADAFPDGLTWVALAPLRDPELVAPTVVRALELSEQPHREAIETLRVELEGSKSLLLLDNAEHLLPALAGELSPLRSVQGPTFLITSRERLQLQGEHVYPVPTLAASDGVTLFVARARALDPDFSANRSVAELCERLDQLPLALELAAARTPLFSVEQLLERLGQRLDLLKGGRDADPRQQTLRATIAWSYELLDDREQQLFARLSVFSGGCTYEAAEGVCQAEPDTLQSLLDKSLLRRRTGAAGEQRFWMLETIREFAAERLEELGDAAELRAKHARYFLAVVEHEEQYARGRDESASYRRLDADLDNLRAAHETAVRTADADGAIRLAGALHPFWYHTSRFDEGHRRATEALALGGATASRSKALGAAGELALMRGDLGEARRHFQSNLALCLEGDDAASLAKAYTLLGHLAGVESDYATAIRYYERTLELIDRGAEEDAWLTRGLALSNLGWGAILAGDLDEATTYLEEALIAARAEGSHLLQCAVLLNLAHVALSLRDLASVRERLQQVLPLLRGTTDRRLFVEFLELLARALAPTQEEAAARLHGAAAELRIAARLADQEPLPHDEWLIEARSRLGDEAWESAEAQGRSAEDPLELAAEYLI
jgi:predicted ATPase